MRARARQDGVEAEGAAEVRVDEGLAGRERVAGIPEPIPVDAPGEAWRSRMREGRWEYNRGYRDDLAAAEQEGRRLRYLIQLFAKEVVLRDFGGATPSELLERMEEVLTRVEAAGHRNGARRG